MLCLTMQGKRFLIYITFLKSTTKMSLIHTCICLVKGFFMPHTLIFQVQDFECYKIMEINKMYKNN